MHYITIVFLCFAPPTPALPLSSTPSSRPFILILIQERAYNSFKPLFWLSWSPCVTPLQLFDTLFSQLYQEVFSLDLEVMWPVSVSLVTPESHYRKAEPLSHTALSPFALLEPSSVTDIETVLNYINSYVTRIRPIGLLYVTSGGVLISIHIYIHQMSISSESHHYRN